MTWHSEPRFGGEPLTTGRGGRLGLSVALCLLLTSFVAPIARAAPTEQSAAANQISVQPAAAPSQADHAVEGFRSAHFGMTEQEVRKAIHEDFSVAAEAVKAGENRAERTRVLTVTVPNVLPGGGRAVVSYVFGYKTRRLIQIGITWSRETDTAITPDTLASDSEVLREYFLHLGYAPASIATNQPIKNGVLAFRGADDKGRETALLLLGTIHKESDKKRVLTPTALQLVYVENPKQPDILRLRKGKF